MTDEGARPVLKVISGSPTPDEIAIVTALIAAAGSGDGAAAEPVAQRGRWNDPAFGHRGRWLPGPGAWRAAAYG